MAITAVNLSYIGKGPTDNGETIADQTSGPMSRRLIGYGQAVLDGSSTTFTANFIDGTKTPFGVWSGPAGNQTLTAKAPVAVRVSRLFQSTDTSGDSATTVTATAAAPTTTGVGITLSAAGSSSDKVSFMVEIIPYLS